MAVHAGNGSVSAFQPVIEFLMQCAVNIRRVEGLNTVAGTATLSRRPWTAGCEAALVRIVMATRT
jgi:hypothetical protein